MIIVIMVVDLQILKRTEITNQQIGENLCHPLEIQGMIAL